MYGEKLGEQQIGISHFSSCISCLSTALCIQTGDFTYLQNLPVILNKSNKGLTILIMTLQIDITLPVITNKIASHKYTHTILNSILGEGTLMMLPFSQNGDKMIVQRFFDTGPDGKTYLL